MAPPQRTHQLHVMLSDDEIRFVRALADADGVSTSDVVRHLVREAFTERWPTKVKPKR